MLDAPVTENQMVTVMVAQTSFAVLMLFGKSFRVDFMDKAEAYLKPGVRGKFTSYLEHPLLLRYNSPIASVYINSRPEDPTTLFSAIQARIEMLLQGWRNWQSVLAWDIHQFEENLLDGSGILLQDAPIEVAKVVIDACAERGVLTWSTNVINSCSPTCKLFLVGDHYVIARGFLFTEVLTKKPLLPSQSA